jgi:AcrR family transcriptional regulator
MSPLTIHPDRGRVGFEQFLSRPCYGERMGVAENRKPGRPRDPDLEARRRAQILDTAAGVFAAHGFASTQVQTIADRLGVGNGTVYRYFPTKEQLFLSAVERGLKELDGEMDAVLAQPLDGPALMRAAVRTYLGFFHRRPEMAELFIQERAAFPHHHRPLYFVAKADEMESKHQAFFARLLDAGVIRPIPRERFFSVIGDLLYGTILTNLLAARPSDPDAQAEDVLDVIFNGLLAVRSDGGR